MEDIYIISVGKYDDYSVVCAFDTEQSAKDYCEEMNNRRKSSLEEEYDYKRVDVNPPLPSQVEEVVEPKTVHVARVEPGTFNSDDGHGNREKRTFYRVLCTCNYRSGPLWTEKSAEQHKERHEKGAYW